MSLAEGLTVEVVAATAAGVERCAERQAVDDGALSLTPARSSHCKKTQ